MNMKEILLHIRYAIHIEDKQITKYKLNEQEFSKIKLRAINGMVTYY